MTDRVKTMTPRQVSLTTQFFSECGIKNICKSTQTLVASIEARKKCFGVEYYPRYIDRVRTQSAKNFVLRRQILREKIQMRDLTAYNSPPHVNNYVYFRKKSYWTYYVYLDVLGDKS